VAHRRTRQAAGITAAASMMLGTPGTALAQDTPTEAAPGGAGVEVPHSEASDGLAELITQLREDSPPDLDPLFDTLEELLL
jgi:hypothetical protein